MTESQLLPKEFEAKLRLKNGELVDAPPEWRKKIWGWWFHERWNEISLDVLKQVSNDLLGRRG